MQFDAEVLDVDSKIDEGPTTNADSIAFEMLCTTFEKITSESKAEKKLNLFFTNRLHEKLAVPSRTLKNGVSLDFRGKLLILSSDYFFLN